MTSAFDSPDGRFHVLANEIGQHSLWPAFIPTPAGWAAVHKDADRQSCADYIEARWTSTRTRPAQRQT